MASPDEIELVESRARLEKRWPVAITLFAAIALELLLPSRFSLGPKWTVPAFDLLLSGVIVAADGGLIERRSTAGRALWLVLVAVLVAEAAGITARLVTDLIEGGPETNSAADLLRTGCGSPGVPRPRVPRAAQPWGGSAELAA